MWPRKSATMKTTVRVRTTDRSILPAMALFAMAASLLVAALVPTAVQAQIRGNAQSEQARGLRDRPPMPAQPGPGRYVSEGGQAFVLDRSGPRTLMRFEQGEEVWVLRPNPAPRGDVIYRNDAGDQVLRVTPDGGMTVFTTRAPQGAPVAAAGSAPSLLPPTLTAIQLWNFIVRQSDRASRALGRLVVVDVDIEPGSEAVAADALSTAVDAIARMARSATLRRQVSQVRRIMVSDEGRPSVAFSQGTLRITIDADAGYAGRPSSARIVRVIAEGG